MSDGRNIWDERIADLRRYDLDLLDQEPMNPMELLSWPIPGLTFVRVDGILRSWDIEREKQSQQQQPQQNQDPNQLPRRIYLSEDALTGLHAQKANLAYLILGSKTGVKYYLGMSMPGVQTGSNTSRADATHYQTLRSLLYSVYNGVDIYKDPFSSEDIKAIISPMANHVGLVTGIPSLKSTADTTQDSEQVERIANGLQGHSFGMLILAVPIPPRMVSREEFSVVDQIQRAQENEDPEKKRRIKYYLELQDSYLKHIQLGTAVGHWQVCTYFFAPDPSVFVRLQSLIRSTYTDEQSRPTPLRTHEMQGLKSHLEQFGLLRNPRVDQNVQADSLLAYRFLTYAFSVCAFAEKRNGRLPCASVC